jgi:hypothetical protein
MVLWTMTVVTSAADPTLPADDDDPIASVESAELGVSDVNVIDAGLSVNVGLSVKMSLKLSNRSVSEDGSRLVVSGAVSNGVDCEAGDCVVMVMLLYCRLRFRGK